MALRRNAPLSHRPSRTCYARFFFPNAQPRILHVASQPRCSHALAFHPALFFRSHPSLMAPSLPVPSREWIDSTRFESGLVSWCRLGGLLVNRPFTTNTRLAYEDDYSKRRQSLQTGEKEVARHTRVIERFVLQPLETNAHLLASLSALAAATKHHLPQHAPSTMISQHHRNQQLPKGIACSFLSVLSLLVRCCRPSTNLY